MKKYWPSTFMIVQGTEEVEEFPHKVQFTTPEARTPLLVIFVFTTEPYMMSPGSGMAGSWASDRRMKKEVARATVSQNRGRSDGRGLGYCSLAVFASLLSNGADVFMRKISPLQPYWHVHLGDGGTLLGL